MTDTLLLTGATGFLGTQVARWLVGNTDCRLIALVRADDREGAERHLARSWWDWPELAGAIGDRVEVLRGDLTLDRLGLDGETYRYLVRRLTCVVHAAAGLRFDASEAELRRVNVEGTARLLELAQAAHADHGLTRFAHLSTAYVAGRREGDVAEADLGEGAGFHGAYERTKYEAERLVRGAGLPTSVFRPGFVVGDSHTGEIKTFNTLYYPLRLYLNGRLPVLPCRPDLRLNLVPVDYVAEAVGRLTLDPRAEGLTFHLTAPTESLPTARELVAFVRGWARETLGLSLPRPWFAPFLLSLAPAAGRLPGRTLTNLSALAPYFGERRRFVRTNTDRLLGPYRLDWRQFLPRLLEFAAYQGFLHRSDRTVQEQLLFRLGSRSRPVRYHDIVQGRLVSRSAAEIREDILTTAGAMRVLGVEPGDRVAVVGLNSTRSLILDAAIGLVGAVSVPLYYTSPPADIRSILAASGARVLFVGAPAVLARLDELESPVPVVSFGREGAGGGAARAMAWEDFLARGRGVEVERTAPVGFGDAATLRYTSGTTGRPRGVVFRHEHLRYMAESLASLPPWRVRHRRVVYLSFLPMNHVVEGILATYSPYYVPAPLDLYFLEDLREVARALPAVRPTMFFSVPRVYEKLWERFETSGPGRVYLRASGARRRLLRPLVRAAFLRRAGLDRCAQLIVGSAPSGEGLLHAYGELGIELHNAYGLTEAPLVTLNRVGANRLGTVGRPLPHTQVRIANDGEVMVRGPQVTPGYFEAQSEPPVRDGWLFTGDLGRLSDDGFLILEGRKKELMITSYGKNVHPSRVEARLQQVPGVTEALLVGDGRPYCAALLWVEGVVLTPEDKALLDAAVARANRDLSHPEQIKAWAVLHHDLSVAGGELTPNLKLRRTEVIRRHAGVVSALYGQGEPPDSVLHLGRVAREVLGG
ncbi:MAG: AMP-binding protein [Anaerolineae bacterium]|nr:AMP-binding protein [Anaerolineae bacterium]